MSMLGTVASLPQNALNLINSHTKSRAVSNSIASVGGAKAVATTATTSTAAQATTDIGTTFLSLLTKELQNQDPTAPMDSTQMVGQMISLNQLDQLIAINTALTPKAASITAPTSHAVKDVTADSASTLAAKQALLASTLPSSATSSQLSADSTLNAAAQSASTTLNLSNFNSMFGGK